MYLLYCDETNLEPSDGDFFLYGGISIPADNALSLSVEIDKLKANYGLSPEQRIKFNPRPSDLSHEQFVALKQAIVEVSIEHDVKLFTSLILHDIARSADEARRNEINRICYHFDCFLNKKESHGLVLIDRFSDGEIDAHLAEKFAVGIRGLPFTPVKRLNNIVGFHYSAIGQSNFPSIVDIVLGSLRYSINGFTRSDEQARGSAGKILPILSPMFFRESGRVEVSDLGIWFSPKDVKSASYRMVYDGLAKYLSENGVEINAPSSHRLMI